MGWCPSRDGFLWVFLPSICQSEAFPSKKDSGLAGMTALLKICQFDRPLITSGII
jgi:hypothetical protein